MKVFNAREEREARLLFNIELFPFKALHLIIYSLGVFAFETLSRKNKDFESFCRDLQQRAVYKFLSGNHFERTF